MILISEMIHPVGLDILSSYEVYYDPDLHQDSNALLSQIARARALIVRNKTQVNAELIERAPLLQVVGRLGVGLDNIHQEVLRERDIGLIVPRGANAISVAEYVIGMAIAFQRHFLRMTLQVRERQWVRDMSGVELAGKTLAVIGYGAAGQAVINRARSFGMKLRIFDPFAEVPGSLKAETVEEALEGADILSLHVPLTHETFHLLNETTLKRLHSHSVVINTARGELIDETALLHALEAKQLGGAILDVREIEPPLQDDRLRMLTNVWSTPHIAGLTEDSQIAIARYVAEGIKEVLDLKR
ncbi:MAG: hydroxyacid dehydrogenase [Sulfobacillus benefaciens]|uniref:Hydroxyacid dehydrogenase n=1 Tax=Sulfobacillus benefaciens TaxID=453960 RepID=A0A2T2WWX3_9FIRM|nr:MAG: hydroxyacid dehydrogenase [Sulfobacillus benefaciens]